MSKAQVPKIIKDTCLDFCWNNEKVWRLKLPIEKLSMAKLAWQFDIPFWRYGNKKYAITPNQVIGNPEKYKRQYDRTMAADLRHPIDIMKNKTGEWEILDGLHRCVKAHVLGRGIVRVRKVPARMIQDCT
jgi:hypothetical protein